MEFSRTKSAAGSRCFDEIEIMKTKIGFIGLGIMGKPMAKNLLKAGHPLVVHDLNRQSVTELVSLGAEEAPSPKEVAQKVRHIITMLPNSPEVREVLTGPNGIIEGAAPGTLVVDMSSISPIVPGKWAKSSRGKD